MMKKTFLTILGLISFLCINAQLDYWEFSFSPADIGGTDTVLFHQTPPQDGGGENFWFAEVEYSDLTGTAVISLGMSYDGATFNPLDLNMLMGYSGTIDGTSSSVTYLDFTTDYPWVLSLVYGTLDAADGTLNLGEAPANDGSVFNELYDPLGELPYTLSDSTKAFEKSYFSGKYLCLNYDVGSNTSGSINYYVERYNLPFYMNPADSALVNGSYYSTQSWHGLYISAPYFAVKIWKGSVTAGSFTFKLRKN